MSRWSDIRGRIERLLAAVTDPEAQRYEVRSALVDEAARDLDDMADAPPPAEVRTAVIDALFSLGRHGPGRDTCEKLADLLIARGLVATISPAKWEVAKVAGPDGEVRTHKVLFQRRLDFENGWCAHETGYGAYADGCKQAGDAYLAGHIAFACGPEAEAS